MDIFVIHFKGGVFGCMNLSKNKTTFLQKIFSVKNDNKHRVIRFFGLKIKFNRNPISTSELISRNLSTYHLHQNVFPKYKNIHRGKDVVLVATGQSLKDYTPIEDAVHIGVNRAFQFDKIKFDYLFIQDYTPPTEDYFDDFMAYNPNECKKFCGIVSGEMMPDAVIPESKCIGSERFYVDHPKYRNTFTRDIASEPFGEAHSIVFPTMQFILWTNPKRIFLVGCDCSASGHYNGKSNCLSVDDVISGWQKMKTFALVHYPDTEIISVNPVGLHGLFKDTHTGLATL